MLISLIPLNLIDITDDFICNKYLNAKGIVFLPRRTLNFTQSTTSGFNFTQSPQSISRKENAKKTQRMY